VGRTARSRPIGKMIRRRKLLARGVAQNPQRPVHALIGMGLEDSSLYAVTPDTPRAKWILSFQTKCDRT
jgi:hypothetical protein